MTWPCEVTAEIESHEIEKCVHCCRIILNQDKNLVQDYTLSININEII